LRFLIVSQGIPETGDRYSSPLGISSSIAVKGNENQEAFGAPLSNGRAKNLRVCIRVGKSLRICGIDKEDHCDIQFDCTRCRVKNPFWVFLLFAFIVTPCAHETGFSTLFIFQERHVIS